MVPPRINLSPARTTGNGVLYHSAAQGNNGALRHPFWIWTLVEFDPWLSIIDLMMCVWWDRF